MSNTVTTEESILDSIKEMLGINAEITEFDISIKAEINTVFANLAQMGVGPKDNEGHTIHYAINGRENVWSEFITRNNLNNVKSYVYYKVKMGFDPPQNSPLINSFENKIRELEVRMYTEEGGY